MVLPITEGTDLVDMLQTMSKEYTYSKIISADPDKLKLIRQLSEESNDIKVQTAKKIETERVDEKFYFILENKLSTEETIQRYLGLVEPDSSEIPLEVINMIIRSDKDYDYLDILNRLNQDQQPQPAREE